MTRTVLALLQLLLATATWAAAPIELKSVPLDDFMHGQLAVSVKLAMPVPVAYEWASLKKTPAFSSYWMRPQDVAAAASSGDLPSDQGYMYGKVSSNVGYDADKKVFIGVDDPESLQKLKRMFPSVTIEHLTSGSHPVLLMATAAPDSGKLTYAMYIGLNVDSMTLFIALRPPGNSQAIGDYIWAELKSAIVNAGPQGTPVSVHP